MGSCSRKGDCIYNLTRIRLPIKLDIRTMQHVAAVGNRLARGESARPWRGRVTNIEEEPREIHVTV